MRCKSDSALAQALAAGCVPSHELMQQLSTPFPNCHSPIAIVVIRATDCIWPLPRHPQKIDSVGLGLPSDGAGEGTRTLNLRITNPVLYQLSYASDERNGENITEGSGPATCRTRWICRIGPVLAPRDCSQNTPTTSEPSRDWFANEGLASSPQRPPRGGDPVSTGPPAPARLRTSS